MREREMYNRKGKMRENFSFKRAFLLTPKMQRKGGKVCILFADM